MLKIQFHIHTSSDPLDHISHTEMQMLDRAAELGYDALSITCHNKIVFSEELKNYAAQKNMLLIPGIEKTVEGRHVLIINAHADAEKIETFLALRAYRKAHPESFVIAPHPYFYTSYCLKEKLEQYIDCFDAIEYSFFHCKQINWNRRGIQIAKKYNKPLLGTSDNHFLPLFNQNYSLVFTDKKTPEDIFDAICRERIEIRATPLSLARFLSLRFEIFARIQLPRYVERIHARLDRISSGESKIKPQTDRISGRA